MSNITPASLKMLKQIRKREFIPENEIPLEMDRHRLQSLVEQGLVATFMLVPPGEEGFEKGLCGYMLSPKGEDAIYTFHKLEIEARIALILAASSLFISLVVAFTPIDEWLTSIFSIIAQ